MPNNVHTEPCPAAAESGHVIVESQSGIAVTLTAEAAERTGANILDASKRAYEQKNGSRPPIE